MIEGIKKRFNDWKEKREFQKQVEEEAKPIRRAAYFEAKKQSASEEGRLIAEQEIEKQRQKLILQKKKTEQIKRTPVQISKPNSTFGGFGGGVGGGSSFGDIMKPSQDWGQIAPEKQSFYPTVNGTSKKRKRRKK